MRHANFEFSTLSTVGGVGFRDKEIYTHSEFYIIVDILRYILGLIITLLFYDFDILSF